MGGRQEKVRARSRHLVELVDREPDAPHVQAQLGEAEARVRREQQHVGVQQEESDLEARARAQCAATSAVQRRAPNMLWEERWAW